MLTTATHNGHDTTTAHVLFLAFALRENTWKLGCTTGHGQQPRARTETVLARRLRGAAPGREA